MARVKGTSLVGVVKALRRNRERAEALLPEPLQDYLETRVLPSDWYPLEDHVELLRVLGEILKPGQGTEVWEVMGRVTAREHLGETYSHLSRGSGSRAAIRRSATLWQTQFDSGRLDLRFHGPGDAEMELVDFALPSSELCGILAGYFLESFEVTGARDVRVEKRECRAGGGARCRWRITWTPRSTAEGGSA